MTPLPRRAPRIAALVLALFGIGLQECSSAQRRSSSDITSSRQDSDGLEIVRWTTTQDTSKLEGILIGFQKRPVMNPLATESLLQEGFFTAIVDQKDLPLIREKLGPSPIDIHTALGTLPNWREVFQRSFPQGQALLMNGRPMTPVSQILQIAARGWSTPTESGGCFQLEIATSIISTTVAQEGLLVRADRPAGNPIANTGIETCLEANEVFLLLTANQSPFKSGRGPGSESPLPPTVGRFLLGESADFSGQETQLKGVTLLAFVPHMSSSIQPARSSVQHQTTFSDSAAKP